MASITEDWKTLMDLQMSAVDSGPQVSPGQSSHVVTPPVTLRPPQPHPTPVNMSAEQLMYQTARLNADLSDVEKNMKKWDDPTQNGWIKFKDLYIEYINNGGLKSLYDLFSKDVIITLRIRLHIKDLKVLNSKDLFNLINFKFKSNSNCQSLLNSITMEDTKYYNREKTELFFTRFLVLLDTYPFIYEIGEEVLVKSFFNKLKPASLSSQLLFLDLKTIAEASVALEDCFMRKDLVLEES